MAPRNWELFFKQEAPGYENYGFTKNTAFEVRFIIEELGLKEGQEILDIGCGTGRHSLALAAAGFKVTGIDLSEDQLQIARAKAVEQGLPVDLIRGDASRIILEKRFDHAICLCEGAFSLFEAGMDPVSYHLDILSNINRMLKPGGRFLLTALNGFRMIRKSSDEDITNAAFDPQTVSTTEEIELKNGLKIEVRQKGFLPSELKRMLESSGFEVSDIWGGTAGAWDKGPLKLDEIEIMVVSRKSAEIQDKGRSPESASALKSRR